MRTNVDTLLHTLGLGAQDIRYMEAQPHTVAVRQVSRAVHEWQRRHTPLTRRMVVHAVDGLREEMLVRDTCAD